MARACTICTHPDRDAIDKAIAGGNPIADVAAQFRVSGDALSRHKAKHIPAVLARVVQLEATAHGLDVMAELLKIRERANLLFDACDRWLRDPDDPTRYNIDPRCEDVTVTYSEVGANGRPIRKKARLSELLNRVDGLSGTTVERAEWRHSDPRELVLKAAETLKSQLEMVIKVIDGKAMEQRLSDLETKLQAMQR